MVHGSGGLVDPSGSIYWMDGIARIMQRRRDEIKRAIVRANRSLRDAEEDCDRANRDFQRKIAKFGEGSDHRDYRNAEYWATRAYRRRKARKSEVDRLDRMYNRVYDEQTALTNSVRSFLAGIDPQTELYSMRLSVKEGVDGDKILDVRIGDVIGDPDSIWGDLSFVFRLDGRMYIKHRR